MKIYNTLTREKENFKPLRQEEVKVYFCGPTVYNYAHIGNLRTYVFEDYVVKALKFLGYKIKTTMNLTDIDDKTIRSSLLNKETLEKFTQKYSDIFLQDIQKLNITPADNIVPISTLIDEMVDMINGLLKKGFAYMSDDGSIYFEIKKFKKYGNLAHLDFAGMKESVRIDNDEYEKENASDFVLWKAYKEEDGQNYWEKAFGATDEKKILKGRPGWHIECSACNLKYFGPQIDIHMGGVDLIFPHHQNEIAQSEAYTGKTFAKYWIHSGHLMVDGKKMAKSANNFYTLRDLEEKFSHIPKTLLYRAIRLSFLNAKYSESVDFSFAKLEQNFINISKFDEALSKLSALLGSNTLEQTKFRRDVREELQDFIGEYVECLENDFNMPEAISIFNMFITFSNTHVDSGLLSKGEAESLFEMFKTFDFVLGVLDFSLLDVSDIPAEILEKLSQRNAAKKAKDFLLADALREELSTLGYKIIDDRNGVRLQKI